MRITSITPSAVFIALVLVAGAGHANEKADLATYFSTRAALAKDDLDSAKEHARALAKSDDKELAKSAETLVNAKDIEAARKAFGEISRTLLRRVEEAQKNGDKLGPIYVFQCPMAKPYGIWLQDTKEIGNPYMGKAMLKCGKLIATKG